MKATHLAGIGIAVGAVGLGVWLVTKQPTAETPEIGQAELPIVTALNPTAANFSPKALILTGRIQNSRTTGYPITWGGDRFELAIIGSSNYYYKEWHGEAGKPDQSEMGSGYDVFLVLDSFAAQTSCRWTHHNTGGGGGGLSPETDCPAKRLWPNEGLIGAKPDELLFEKWGRTEEFSKLKSFGSILIPRKIIRTETFNPGEVVTKEYTVDEVIFSNEPSAQWLDKIKEKYFKDHIQTIDQLQTNASPKIIDATTNKFERTGGAN